MIDTQKSGIRPPFALTVLLGLEAHPKLRQRRSVPKLLIPVTLTFLHVCIPNTGKQARASIISLA